jgi:hypothetical protein
MVAAPAAATRASHARGIELQDVLNRIAIRTAAVAGLNPARSAPGRSAVLPVVQSQRRVPVRLTKRTSPAHCGARTTATAAVRAGDVAHPGPGRISVTTT